MLLADLNDDARPDLFVTDDMTPNLLYFNRGDKLEEKAALAGVAIDEQGRVNGNMGVDVGDYDRSGRASLWITVFQNETHVPGATWAASFFNINRGLPASRPSASTSSPLERASSTPTTTAGRTSSSPAGTCFAFLPVEPPSNGLCCCGIPNSRGGDSSRISVRQAAPYFETRQLGRGAAIGDIDNDGWADLIVSHTNCPVILLRNQAAKAQATPHHWLGLQLAGRGGRDIVGSTVIVESNGRKLTRFAKGGGSYCSSGDRRLLFGLGESDSIERVTVKWSWGQTQTWDKLAADQYWELKEGETEAASPPHP